MNKKNNIIRLAVSFILVVFGIIILLGQLNITNISDIFKDWRLLLMLALISISLIYAIVNKAPYWYITTFTLVGIYLALSLTSHIEALEFSNLILLVPLCLGVGIMVAKVMCVWKAKVMWLGLFIALSSSFLLTGTILKISEYVIPIFFILLGILLFARTAKKFYTIKKKKVKVNYYVTPTIKEEFNNDNDSKNDNVER